MKRSLACSPTGAGGAVLRRGRRLDVAGLNEELVLSLFVHLVVVHVFADGIGILAQLRPGVVVQRGVCANRPVVLPERRLPLELLHVTLARPERNSSRDGGRTQVLLVADEVAEYDDEEQQLQALVQDSNIDVLDYDEFRRLEGEELAEALL